MKKFVKTLFISTFLVAAASLPVLAQDTDLQSLLDRMERMDRDIKALNLKVYRGGAAGSGEATAVASGGGEDVSGPLGARLSVRINELENQMRQLTGQLEETAYRITQMTTRMDKLVADVDYRLTSLEGGMQAPRPASSQEAATTPQNAQTAQGIQGQQLAAPATGQTAPAPTASQPGVLGTLSGQDLKNPSLTATEQPAPVTPQETAVVETANLTPEALYESSRQKLMRGEVGDAEKGFKSFLSDNKGHKLTGNVRYWLGETYYVQGNYAQAASTFLEGYQKDPRGAKAPDSLLKLGMSLSKMEKLREACATFGKLRGDFPKMPAHLSKTLERERTNAKCN